MVLKKKATVMASLVLFLMAALSATVPEARRFDPDALPAETVTVNGGPNNHIKSNTTACCNHCACSRSIPPRCRCRDSAETCRSACEACACTASVPPHCRCLDTTRFCYSPC